AWERLRGVALRSRQARPPSTRGHHQRSRFGHAANARGREKHLEVFMKRHSRIPLLGLCVVGLGAATLSGSAATSARSKTDVAFSPTSFPVCHTPAAAAPLSPPAPARTTGPASATHARTPPAPAAHRRP